MTQREANLHETEIEWDQRREAFENQWAEYENIRQEQLQQIAEQQTRLEERQRYLADWETRLKAGESELFAREDSVKLREKQNAIDAEKYKRLREKEEEIQQSQSESIRLRESLVRERHQLLKTFESDRQRLKETHVLATKRLEEERAEWASQNKRVEQMRTSLERSREELGRMHRETLEVRLATEELWLRLAGDSASETLTDSLERIRTKLAEQNRSALVHVEKQKEELKQLRQQLLSQQENLLQRRDELDLWANRCEEALLEKESQLQKREEELDRQQASAYEILRRQRNVHAE